MAYLKINDTNYDSLVMGMKITDKANYSSQTNAKGDTFVDFKSSKKKVEITFIPMEDDDMKALINEVYGFSLTLEYRDPSTQALKSIDCICASSDVEYYTIQTSRVLYKKLKLTFQEL